MTAFDERCESEDEEDRLTLVRANYRARLNRRIKRAIFGIRLARACRMPTFEERHTLELRALLRERSTT